jgi:ribosomal protein L11 methyltransferase
MPAANIAPWWEACLESPDALVDELGAALIAEGATGTQVFSAATPLPTLSPATEELQPPFLAAPEHSLVCASFADDWREAEVMDAAKRASQAAALPPDHRVAVRRRTDSDWAERWKQFFVPLAAGERLWVVPSWEQSFVAPKDAVIVRLDPGMAFGTGQHATTALCLGIVDARLGQMSANERAALRLLDVGCGSGILAIAATLLGCRMVAAIDNDPFAVEATRDNARLNGVHDQVVASDTDLGRLEGRYDWVIANIIAPTLIELAPALIGHVDAGGELLLSGILDVQEDEVLAAFAAAAHLAGRRRPELTLRRQQGEWLALNLTLA